MLNRKDLEDRKEQSLRGLCGSNSKSMAEKQTLRRRLITKVLPRIGLHLFLVAQLTLCGFAQNGSITIQDRKQETDKNASHREGMVVSTVVDLVMVDVSVIGKPTSELQYTDFIIYDNGVVQPVDLFSQGEFPIAVALLIDAGLSAKPYMPEMRLAGIAALRQLKKDDKFVLYSFGSVVKRHTELTNDLAMAADALNGIESRDGKALCDAIVDASDYLSQNAPESSRVIILISNNQSGSTVSLDLALDKLLKTSATLYSLMVQRTNASPPGRESQESVLLIPKMVEETGGELFGVKEPGALQDALSNTILNIRKQYKLGFIPSKRGKAGTYHKLEIKLASPKSCPECILRFRKGYYNEAPAPSVPRGGSKEPFFIL
jgi:VWFA-related protein